MPTKAAPQPRPIIPWMRGKRRLAKHLLPLFPDHSCYIELFAGGAALFFMRETPAKVEVLNDINGDLTNLYRVLQHHYDEFMRQFAWTLTSRQTFALLQSTPPETLTDIRALFKAFEQSPLQLTYTMSRTKGKAPSGELVIRNYR